jgi:hypothetical protein
MGDSIRETRQLSLARVSLDAIIAAIALLPADLAVPAADGHVNLLERDVIGNKEDAAVTTLDNVTSLMAYIKGILDQLAIIVPLISSELILTETSGTLLATGGVDTVVINNAPAALFKPLKVEIDLTNMAAADTTTIVVNKRLTNGGGLIVMDTMTFTGVQAVPGKTIELAENRWGFSVTLQQSAGVMRNYVWEYICEQ